MTRMLEVMVHRGPDDVGMYFGNGAMLGQRRLSIIDLDGGKQPIPNEDKSKWIICNGEIYNYKELRQDLIKRGHHFRTRSDSEVILHLYEEYGEKCVKHLRGMFAFAIWNNKERTLFAARDHLGQKPFFFVQRNGEFAFGSEIKSILAFDPDLAEMDLASLDQYLTLRIIAPPRTMFREIRKLAPAHWLRYSPQKGLEVRRYWVLEYEPKHKGSDTELVDELEERIVEALKLHMVSDVPVGAFLSGGLDSTLVVSILMQRVAQEPIMTFSFGLPYGRFNEAPYARMVAEKYGTIHHETVITPSLLDNLPQLIWHLDEPSDPLSVCSYLIAKEARKQVKVVIGGDGGDELFGGYDRYYGNLYAGYYGYLPEVMRKRLVSPLLDRLPDGGWYKSSKHQLKWLHELSFLEGSDRYAASLSYFYFGSRWKEALYGPMMRGSGRSYDPGAAIRQPFDEARAQEGIDRMLHSDSIVRLPDHPVMILDRMAMANSLETRSPFMDHKLAEYAARLPMRMKVRGWKLRFIEKRLAERYLPEAVLKRPKQGFSSALPYLLRQEYEMLYKTLLGESHLARDGILQQEEIRRIFGEHQVGRADHGNRLWLLINSEAWYRMFIERASVGDLEGDIRKWSI